MLFIGQSPHRNRVRSFTLQPLAAIGFLYFACWGFPVAADDLFSQPVGYQPVVGQPHPDLELPDIESGRTVSLSGYRGRKVLLIHFASW